MTANNKTVYSLPVPRRSVLYMPASNQRAMTKAQSLDADVIVFDLEDAVAPSQKVKAREILAQQLQQASYGNREVMVRINGGGTPWHQQDLELLWGLPIDGVVLPKVENADEINSVIHTLSHPPKNIEVKLASHFSVWPMIETPTGVFAAREIVNTDPRVNCLVMGTSDLAKEMRLPVSVGREGLLAALSHCVLAASEKLIDVLDGVCLDIHDQEVLQQQTEQGRMLGFTGKTLIHPKQLAVANEVFGISEQQLAKAQAIIEAWQQAEKRGEGVVVVDDRLVESLHYDDACRVVALAKAIAKE